MMNISTEQRRGKLRSILKEKKFLRVIETVNGLEGMIAENARVQLENGSIREYDALWFSGLCHAAFKGKPDNELVDMSEKLSALNDILAVTTKPIIMDMDTGGITEHLCHHVALLERMGVSAVVIEDKTGLKRNSLYGKEQLHHMEDMDVFADKIICAKKSICTNDFMIFARIESLIAGEDIQTALERAGKYIDAGADGIVIHSVCADGSDIFAFSTDFKKRFADVPLVFIPTAYNSFTDTQLHEKGADMIIYANHLMRSAYQAMEKTATSILSEGRSLYADKNYCATVKTILNLIDGE